MRKYITTDKHHELKEGILFEYFSEDLYCSVEGWTYIDKEDIPDMIKNGFLKEIQKPKWTDEDMIDCLIFGMEDSTLLTVKEIFEYWKKQRKQ